MKKLITCLKQHRTLALAVAAASALVLAAALVSQYGFGLKPCELCLLQRWPYAINIVLGLLAFGTTYRYPRLAALIITLAAAVFFIDAAFAAYHVGVERHWWAGPSACTGSFLTKNMTLQQLQEMITHKDVVRCDVISWELFGITMAGYNFAVALLLGIGTLCLRGKKHDA